MLNGIIWLHCEVPKTVPLGITFSASVHTAYSHRFLHSSNTPASHRCMQNFKQSRFNSMKSFKSKSINQWNSIKFDLSSLQWLRFYEAKTITNYCLQSNIFHTVKAFPLKLWNMYLRNWKTCGYMNVKEEHNFNSINSLCLPLCQSTSIIILHSSIAQYI